MICKNYVLLLKTQVPEGASDKYEDILKANSFEVRLVKTLDFDFKNLEKLQELLEKPDEFSGLIFSSPRCVEAVYKGLISHEIKEKWKQKLNYAVGETTYRDVLDKIGLDCLGKESGNALNLSSIILANRASCDKSFLFPHGNLKTDTLKTELNKEGLDVQGILVYDSITNQNIGNELKEATEDFARMPEYIVLFSPSGLNASLPYLQSVSDLKDIKFVAVGPVTANAIRENNLNVYSVATNPTPKDILNAIKNC